MSQFAVTKRPERKCAAGVDRNTAVPPTNSCATPSSATIQLFAKRGICCHRLTIKRHMLRPAERRIYNIRVHDSRMQRHDSNLRVLGRNVGAQLNAGELGDGVCAEARHGWEDGKAGGYVDDCWVRRGEL